MEDTRNNISQEQRKKHIVWHGFASFCITPKMQDAVLTYFETPENALKAKGAEWDTFFRLAQSIGFTEKEKGLVHTFYKWLIKYSNPNQTLETKLSKCLLSPFCTK